MDFVFQVSYGGSQINYMMCARDSHVNIQLFKNLEQKQVQAGAKTPSKSETLTAVGNKLRKRK